ncbi:MAG: DUF58 domain-containing protein [Planctomycetes bacterium]|nr:DUF58 domain-containing protein [Planctomycetota bacterium]
MSAPKSAGAELLEVRPSPGLARLAAVLFAGLVLSGFFPGALWAAALLLALAAALVAIAYLLGRANLRCLEASEPAPATSFAWEALPVRLELRNRSRRLAAQDLLLHHSDRPQVAGRLFGQVTELGPGRTRQLEAPFRPPRRGRYPVYHLSIVSSFPFGLFEWRRRLPLPAELTALPRLGSLLNESSLFPERSPAAGARGAKGRGDEEFHSLKEWRAGMSPRRISWKASARLQRWVVRESRGENPPEFHVVLSGFGEVREGARSDPSFEKAVSLAATLAEHLLRRKARLRFSFHGPGGFTLQPPRGRDGLVQVLGSLVDVSRSAVRPGGWTRPPRRAGEITLLVVAGGGSRTIRPGESGPSGRVRRPDKTGGRYRVLDIDRPGIHQVFRMSRREQVRLRQGEQR